MSTVGGELGGMAVVETCAGGMSAVECCEAPENPLVDGLFAVSLGTMLIHQFGLDPHPDAMDTFRPLPDAYLNDADETPIGSSPLNDTPFILGAGALGSAFSDPYIVFETPTTPPDDGGGLNITRTSLDPNWLDIVPL